MFWRQTCCHKGVHTVQCASQRLVYHSTGDTMMATGVLPQFLLACKFVVMVLHILFIAAFMSPMLIHAVCAKCHDS